MVIALHRPEILLKNGRQLSITNLDKKRGLAVSATEKVFRSQFPLVHYIVVNGRCDVFAAADFIAPFNEKTTESQLASIQRAIQDLQSAHK